jgi:hypothetical protein
MRKSYFQTAKMQLPSTTESRITEFAKLIETKGDIASLQQHLKEVIDGDVFKGSHRSGQFLQYVVDQAIAGHFESLKERVIGMELFGRSASYDTGDDAIVRVTASDVRKRLLQHYGRYGATSEYRINLPSGSYIPEITRVPHDEVGLFDGAIARGETGQVRHDSSGPNLESVPVPRGLVMEASALPQVEATQPKRLGRYRWLFLGILIVAINLTLWGIFWNRPSPAETPHTSSLPWSLLFGSSRGTELITSDPNIAEIQGISGGQVSVSDYANHNYLSGSKKLTPEEEYFCITVLGGNKASSNDIQIVANIAQLAQINSRKIDVYAARQIQLKDLRTDNNFIFLGSPRSDPWTDLFSDELDFRFVFDKAAQSEFILNVHPRRNERPTYIPSARGSLTGDTFAIIALLRNPDQDGRVLILAGATAEGTSAAGKLATDEKRFLLALQQCGINPNPSEPLPQFELLLHLNAFAGSPSHTDVEACHILPDSSTH